MRMDTNLLIHLNQEAFTPNELDDAQRRALHSFVKRLARQAARMDYTRVKEGDIS